MVLERLALQPPDPLLAVIGLFAADPRPGKIDLGVGVYRDEHGLTPVMRAVKAAEARLVEQQASKAYVGPSGDLEFIDRLGELVFGPGAPTGRIVGLQTPGGTGALRAAADLLARGGAGAVWVGRPPWANHDPVFAAAGLAVRDYDYFDPARQGVDFESMVRALRAAKAGEVVLLQAACHNPTGADPTPDQWRTIAEIVGSRGLIPLIDVAYQGLGAGLEDDAAGARAVIAAAGEALVAVSCSKSFGLYRERTGALYAVTAGGAPRAAVESNMLAIARANYSMPPDHGAAVVRTILADPALASDWRDELAGVRARIGEMRAALVAQGRCGAIDLAALAAQQGMFSLLPLEPAQIRALREEHAIYMTGSGRVNLAGLQARDMETLARALAGVTGGAPAR
jgi:aromatic-amino-acid transaminase